MILTNLHLYAADHDGNYPDAKDATVNSSNKAFRKLFIDEITDSETIFGCSRSRFNPDGKIGDTPKFLEALGPGENHWAMTKGVTDSLPGNVPLVLENPLSATWPPQWNARTAETYMKGKAWRGDLVIIGQNDTSVTLHKLASKWGKAVDLKPGPDGKGLFEAAIDPEKFPKGEILDVEQ